MYPVFISYAHIDNRPLTEEQKGWVTTFHQALAIRLGQLVGTKAPIVWRDNELDGAHEFDDEIRQKVSSAEIFVSVLSPSYVRASPYCLQELNGFVEAVEQKGGLTVGTRSRVVKVVKTPVPLEEHPDPIRRVLGYHFFQERSGGGVDEFGYEKGSPRYHEFWARFEDVAGVIKQMIEDLATTGVEAPGGRALTDSRSTIFLAEPASELFSYRDQIRRNFEEQGFVVFPRSRLPLRKIEGDARSVVREALEPCSLSVQLIGATQSGVPEGERASLDRIQNELIAEWHQSRPEARRLVWIPKGLTDEEASAQPLLLELEHEVASVPGSEVVRSEFEDFLTHMTDTLAALDQGIDRKAGSRPRRPARVYLLFDPSDTETAQSVDDVLFDEGVEVLYAPEAAEVTDKASARVEEVHLQQLGVADAVLVILGRAPAIWFETQMTQFRVLLAAPDSRVPPLTVLVTGEPTPAKTRFRSREVSVIKALGDFDPAQLTEFTAALWEDAAT